MTATQSISGIASGLQTDEIISKIMEYAHAPVDELESQVSEAQQQLSTWQSLNTRVLAVKVQAAAVADAADFGKMTVTSSNEDVLTASASTTAEAGTYYVTVGQVAKASQVATSTTYTSVSDAVGTGTVTVSLADDTSVQVTLDSTNNTLSGLRDAINKAGGGAKATIINSGTSETPSYQLVLTSTRTGLDYAIAGISSTLSGGTTPEFNTADPLQPAADAIVYLGQGTGKITVTKSSNRISDLIPGLTINVASAEPDKTIAIGASRDTASIQDAITSFVDQYNDLASAISDQFDYDTDTQQSGVLMGDYKLQTVQADMQRAVTAVVTGLTGDYTALAQIGITMDSTGQLSVNSSELSSALSEDPDAIAKLFTNNLDSSSSYVSMSSFTSDTQESGKAGWQVVVTQTATRAQVTAGAEFTGVADSGETLTINGQTITLNNSMTTLESVVAEINKHSSDTGVTALATGIDGTGEGNYLTLRNNSYGSKYSVSVVSSASLTTEENTGFGNELATSWTPSSGENGTAKGSKGLDVAGTINGETATGNGQILSIKSTTSTNKAKGLALKVTATEPMTTTVTYTKGVGARVRDLIENMTDADGVFSTAEDSLNTHIDDLQKSISDYEDRLSRKQESLELKFQKMESAMSELQDQSNYLSALIDSMSSSKSSSKSS